MTPIITLNSLNPVAGNIQLTRLALGATIRLSMAEIIIKGVTDRDLARIVAIPDQLDAVLALGSLLGGELNHIKHRLGRVMDAEHQEQVDIAALAQQVADSTELDKSIKVLVEGIAVEMDKSTDPRIKELSEKLRTSAIPLAEAVQANLTDKENPNA